MPNAVVQSYAKQSGESVEAVEKMWDEAKASAHKAHPDWKDGDRLYAYVNGTVAKRLGLKGRSTNESTLGGKARKLNEAKSLTKAQKNHPFYCFKRGCRKSAWETPEYLTEADWDFTRKVVEILKSGTPDDLYEALRSDAGQARRFFDVILGWPEGFSYCLERSYVEKTAFEGMRRHELDKLEMALDVRGGKEHTELQSRPLPVRESVDAVRLIKRDCGIHSGPPRANGDNGCRKCGYINQHREEHPECYQAGGTPYVALLGNKVGNKTNESYTTDLTKVLSAKLPQWTFKPHGNGGAVAAYPPGGPSKDNWEALNRVAYISSASGPLYVVTQLRKSKNESGSLIGAESPSQVNSQGMFESLLDIGTRVHRIRESVVESIDKPATLVGRTDKYDFYEGEDGGRAYWNIVPSGSEAPTGGYRGKEHIEQVKGVKFSEAKPVNESTEGDGLCGYVAFYRGKRTEVRAKTKLAAQEMAAKKLGAKKSYEVNVELAERPDGSQVVHTAT